MVRGELHRTEGRLTRWVGGRGGEGVGDGVYAVCRADGGGEEEEAQQPEIVDALRGETLGTICWTKSNTDEGD